MRSEIRTQNKRAPFGALELLRLLFRLRDGDSFARVPDFESRKAADGNVLAQLADLGCDQLGNRDGLVLDERLLV